MFVINTLRIFFRNQSGGQEDTLEKPFGPRSSLVSSRTRSKGGNKHEATDPREKGVGLEFHS